MTQRWEETNKQDWRKRERKLEKNIERVKRYLYTKKNNNNKKKKKKKKKTENLNTIYIRLVAASLDVRRVRNYRFSKRLASFGRKRKKEKKRKKKRREKKKETDKTKYNKAFFSLGLHRLARLPLCTYIYIYATGSGNNHFIYVRNIHLIFLYVYKTLGTW